MLRVTEIRLPLDHGENDLREALVRALGIRDGDLSGFSIFRRNIDARKKNAICLVYTLDAETPREAEFLADLASYPNVKKAPERGFSLPFRARPGAGERPVVVGAGPCGYFAALALARMGFSPLVLERGKPVKERAADTFGFWKKGRFDPESNVQFGEGGAGAFSDGKLHTRIRDREGMGRWVLEELARAGAPPEIVYIGKPHVGTFRLMAVVENLRREIETLGGEVRFRARVDEILAENGRVAGVRLSSGEEIACARLILALGHSARDTFRMLLDAGVELVPKPFSMGLRIEHPQVLIDKARLGKNQGNPLIGAADYRLVHHSKTNRSVYTFCMCPGGRVVAAASEPGGVVTNGMSQYARNERNANSALVVGVGPEDFPSGPLGGVDFQREWEAKAFAAGGGDYSAPAQRVEDFLLGRPSEGLGPVAPSYRPGVRPADLSACLPPFVAEAIREAIPAFAGKVPGFDLPDALLTGVETRTSSPVRIVRGPSGESESLAGLYPAGEGAGYAGGILSSAVDGLRAALAAAKAMEG